MLPSCRDDLQLCAEKLQFYADNSFAGWRAVNIVYNFFQKKCNYVLTNQLWLGELSGWFACWREKVGILCWQLDGLIKKWLKNGARWDHRSLKAEIETQAQRTMKMDGFAHRFCSQKSLKSFSSGYQNGSKIRKNRSEKVWINQHRLLEIRDLIFIHLASQNEAKSPTEFAIEINLKKPISF